jgi:phage I-like protein
MCSPPYARLLAPLQSLDTLLQVLGLADLALQLHGAKTGVNELVRHSRDAATHLDTDNPVSEVLEKILDLRDLAAPAPLSGPHSAARIKLAGSRGGGMGR